MKTLKSIFMASFVGVTIVSIAVVIVFYQAYPIYQLSLKISPKEYRFESSAVEALVDVKTITDYTLGKGEFELKSYTASKTARIHFLEVRNIFMTIRSFMVSCLLIGILILLIDREKRYFNCKLNMQINLIGSVILLVLFLFWQDYFYVLFHKLIFDNNYWIFDNEVDTIINILPQSYFVLCLFFILWLIVVLNIIFCLFYRKIVLTCR